MTLSHRWPHEKSRILRLTALNLTHFEHLIPQESSEGFSKVFADAFTICRHLSIRYIWIDSLCIIQEGDGGVDWNREASRMGDVYKHAVCCISAESIVDPDQSVQQGIFRTRNPALVAPKSGLAPFDTVADAWESGGAQIVSRFTKKSPSPGHFHILPEDDWSLHVLETPLNRRGWVIQERQLSPRILHFAANQIYFECYEMIASETYARGDPIYSSAKPPRSKAFLHHLALRRAGILNSITFLPGYKHLSSSPLIAWYVFVQKYNGAGLSKPSDKLIAIAGLAKEIGPYLGATASDYLAGIWVQSLPYGLMWRTQMLNRPETTHVRSTQYYQAPTWSWASLNWSVGWQLSCHSQPHDVLISLVEHHIAPVSDPFGEVHEGAYIKLKGMTYGIRLVWTEAKTNYKPAPKFYAEVWAGTGKFIRKWGGDVAFPDERYIEGDPTTQNRDDLRVMPILRSKVESQWKWMEMLMLAPTELEGVYTRFGVMNVGGKIGREWFEWHTSNVVGRGMARPREEVVTII